jgi:type II secretory pathway predicted ATPase ExeA
MMTGYRQFHNLGKTPFGKALETRDLLLYNQLNELSTELDELLIEGGVGLLTGEMGAGKTTALRYYLHQLHAQGGQIQVAYHGSCRHSVSVLSGLVEALGVVPSRTRVTLLGQLSRHLQRTYREQRQKSLLVVDDAHLLEDSLYEDLRLLTKFGMDSEDAAILLLVGHPALRARLAQPVHLALLDRVRLHYRLEGLSRDETEAYLDHHLQQAGGRPDIFTQASKHAIFEHSGGIPRRINALALLALKKSTTRKLSSIDADFIKAILPQLIQSHSK